MPFATVAEAEARIAELEAEGKTITRDLMTHKKGYKQLSEFLSAKGFDPNGNLEDQWEATAGKSKTELETTAKSLEKMQRAHDKLLQDLAAERTEKEQGSIRNELSNKMRDIVGGEDHIELLIAKGKVKLEKGKIVYLDGDKETPADTYIESYRKNNPDRVRVKQADGGQSANSRIAASRRKRR